MYKDPKYGAGAPYPIHMELNDWAKNELGTFCESLIEEYEDDLTHLLSDEEEDKAGLPEKVCKHKLALCVPPPPSSRRAAPCPWTTVPCSQTPA